MMYHFSIVEPFKLNWKYVVPKDFDTLEYFLKPGLSIELSNIANGPKRFAIGAYLTEGNNRNKFNNEMLPARSDERIATAFQKEEVSCFFTPEDAEALEKLFEEEKFICRTVVVRSKEHGDDFFGLPTDQYNLMLDAFSELGVKQVADIKENRELFEGLRDEALKEIRDETRREQRAQATGKKTEKDKRKIRIHAMTGSGLIGVGATLKHVAKKMATKGFFGFVGSVVTNLLSASFSMIGIKLLGGAAEAYVEGM